jgi:hypothetical protein
VWGFSNPVVQDSGTFHLDPLPTSSFPESLSTSDGFERYPSPTYTLPAHASVCLYVPSRLLVPALCLRHLQRLSRPAAFVCPPLLKGSVLIPREPHGQCYIHTVEPNFSSTYTYLAPSRTPTVTEDRSSQPVSLQGGGDPRTGAYVRTPGPLCMFSGLRLHRLGC